MVWFVGDSIANPCKDGLGIVFFLVAKVSEKERVFIQWDAVGFQLLNGTGLGDGKVFGGFVVGHDDVVVVCWFARRRYATK